MKKALLSLLSLTYASMLFGADAYMIESQIIKDGKVIDSPSLIAPINQAGAVEVDKGENKYEFLAEVADEKNGIVTLYTNLTLNGKFHKQKAKIPLKELVTLNLGSTQLKVRIIPFQ